MEQQTDSGIFKTIVWFSRYYKRGENMCLGINLCSAEFPKLETYNKEERKKLFWTSLFLKSLCILKLFRFYTIAIMILPHLVLCIAIWSSAFLQLFEHWSGYWILGINSIARYILRLEFLPPACSQFHRLTFAQCPVTISLSAHFFVNFCLQGPIWAHSDTKVGMASHVILDLIIAE